MLTRRDFIRSTLLTSGSLLLTSCSRLTRLPGQFGENAARGDLPIDHRFNESIAPRHYFGPNPHAAHPHLWGRTQKISPSAPDRLPLPTPAHTVIHKGPLIIGGGISGLTSAYYLREKNPLVLEASTHLGGNSQGQEWMGVHYSIGAAYFVVPEPGDTVHSLITDLNLMHEIRTPEHEDMFAEGANLRKGLWEGGGERYGDEWQKVLKLQKYLSALVEDEAPHRFPDIPLNDPEIRAYVNELDTVSFAEHLKSIIEGELPYPLSQAVEQYCWSAFGASSNEISAASGLNFFASEGAEIAALPGGNSRVAERLCEEIIKSCGDDSLRSNILVLNVRATENGVEVLTMGPTGEVQQILAPAAIVACPKFVAKKIVEGCTPKQYEAMHRLKYRAYLTANVVVKGAPSFEFYDLFLLEQGEGKGNLNPQSSLADLGATDAILANWALGAEKSSQFSVLTLYRALPFDGGRVQILADESYEATRKAFEKQIYDELLPLFGLPKDCVTDLRITRWGHALPVAATGLIAAGIPELLKTPVGGRIFFAQQDNWALPAFEVAVAEARDAADGVLDVL